MKKLITTTVCLSIALYCFSQQPQQVKQKIEYGNQSINQLKNSPAGSKVLAVLNAINLQGEKIDEAFMKKYFSPGVIERNSVDRLIKILASDIPENDGVLTVYEVNRLAKLEFKVYAKRSVSGEWLEMGFKIESASPYRIDGITLEGGGPEPSVGSEIMNISGK